MLVSESIYRLKNFSIAPLCSAFRFVLVSVFSPRVGPVLVALLSPFLALFFPSFLPPFFFFLEAREGMSLGALEGNDDPEGDAEGNDDPDGNEEAYTEGIDVTGAIVGDALFPPWVALVICCEEERFARGAEGAAGGKEGATAGGV